MKRAGREAKLVEQYIDDLLANQDAPPPPELDDETAFMARALVITRQLDLPEDDVKERIWNRILFALHLKPDANVQREVLSERAALPVESISSKREKKNEVVQATLRHTQRNGQPHRLSWLRFVSGGTRPPSGAMMLIATVLIVVFFGGVIIHNLVLTTPNVSSQRQSPTATVEQVRAPDHVQFDPGLDASLQVWNEEFSYENQQPIRINDDLSLTPFGVAPQ